MTVPIPLPRNTSGPRVECGHACEGGKIEGHGTADEQRELPTGLSEVIPHFRYTERQGSPGMGDPTHALQERNFSRSVVTLAGD